MSRALSVLLFIASPAFAQEDDVPDDATPEIVYKAVTEVTFDDLAVGATLLRPDARMVVEMRRAAFNPLLRMQDDFDAQMMRTVDAVK